MSTKINILPEALQNQIAAGEVVERPASVLKELVENSLDAGADRIELSLEQGGQNLIMVQDNGRGIPWDQLPLALSRHATSKIQDIQDLTRMYSFGFRGEALPSIASVSRLNISSIVQGQDAGYRVQVAFGRITDQGPTPLRTGTRVEVRDLFLQTPARLKFLKTKATEAKKCQEVLQQFALAHCAKHFLLYIGNKISMEFSPDQSLEQRLQLIWPEQITRNMLQVSFASQDMTVQGLAGSPETAQGKPGRTLFFINNRPVQSRLLQSALKQAYQGKILAREYPQAVIFLQLDPELLDINVHPAKLEVRFRDEGSVFRLVNQGIAKALEKETPGVSAGAAESSTALPQVKQNSGNRYKFQTFEHFLDQSLAEDSGTFSAEQSGLHKTEPQNTEQQTQAAMPTGSADHGLPNLSYLGQLDRSYLLLLQNESRLLCLDQHAVHERVLFDRFKARSKNPTSQRLGLDMQLNLHVQEQNSLEYCALYLRQAGFIFSRPEKSVLLVQAIPEFMSPQEASSFLRQILQDRINSMDGIWTSLACRQAVKSGDTLSTDEALQLISAWQDCPDRGYCPHGRPSVIILDSQTLARMFKRQ